MARPRAFDTDQALEAAMHVFWLKGYEGASLSDLLDAMQIARGSLYKAFEDKRSIYLAALDRYDRRVVEGGVVMLDDRAIGDGMIRVERLLHAAVEPVAQMDDRRGCFLCNAAVERAPVDADVEKKVQAMLKRLEDGIARALSESRVAGAWDHERCRAAARALTTFYMGLRVMAKAGQSARDLRGIIRTTLSEMKLIGRSQTS